MADTTLYPTADAYIHLSVPNSNFGAAALLVTQTWINNDVRSFLKFSLATLPAGAVITLAKLRLNCYVVSGSIAGVTDVQARRVADDTWTELGITWTNQPPYGVVEDTKVPAAGWVEWDITSWVQNEWAGDKVVSICLRCVQEGYDGISRYSYYRSREYDGFDPELYIEYTVPVKAKPSSIIPLMRVMDMISAVKPWSKRFPKFKPRLVT